MQREILFKAKRKDNKEWVYGDLIDGKFFFDKSSDYYDAPYYDDELGVIDGRLIEVISETVCQYTNLKDKNGKKIFENDIVFYSDFTSVYKDDIIGVIKYTQDCMFEIEYDDKYVRGGKTTRPLVCHEHSTFTSKKIEVIGNISDNRG